MIAPAFELLLALALPAARQSGPAELDDAFCAAVDQERLLRTVRELVAIGARMGGTPSGDAAAKYHAARFTAAGLAPARVVDPELRAFEPKLLAANITIGEVVVPLVDGALALHTPGIAKSTLPLLLELPKQPRDAPDAAWALLVDSPSHGEQGPTAAARTRQALSNVTALPSAARPRVLLVAFDQRIESSTPVLHQGRELDGSAVTLLTISKREAAKLREAAAAAPGATPQLSITADVFDGPGHPVTVFADIATFADIARATPAPAADAPILLFCAHGDSDAGSLGADDNGSGDAVVLELAEAFALLRRERQLSLPFTLRFVVWGSEMHSSRAWLERIRADGSLARHVAVINFDQAGVGAERECVYFEPDDWPLNEPLIRAGLEVAGERVGRAGYWQEYTSNAALGGTDSYVFAPGGGGAGDVPAITIFSAAFGEAELPARTPGFPSRFADVGGKVLVDYSRVYHETGDRPENTIDLEPWNMVRVARAAGLMTLRLARQPERVADLLARKGAKR